MAGEGRESDSLSTKEESTSSRDPKRHRAPTVLYSSANAFRAFFAKGEQKGPKPKDLRHQEESLWAASNEKEESGLLDVSVTEPPDDEAKVPDAIEAQANRLHMIDSKQILNKVMKSPESRKHSAIISALPITSTQKNFEDRPQILMGDILSNLGVQSYSELGIGWSCRKGIKPAENQDDFFIYVFDDMVMIGIADGHGACGSAISAYVKSTLPEIISAHPTLTSDPNKAFRESFLKVHDEVVKKSVVGSSFDASMSGSTATIMVYHMKTDKIHVGHVGDTRLICGYKKAGKLHIGKLTNDHKPEREKERIEAAGGEVRQPDNDLSWRIFHKGREFPGISMSRSIGDVVGCECGIIPEPDVCTIELTRDEDDKCRFFVMATDGIWEILKSKVVVSMVAAHAPRDVQKAVLEVADLAQKLWCEEEKGNFADDMSVIVFHPYHCKDTLKKGS